MEELHNRLHQEVEVLAMEFVSEKHATVHTLQFHLKLDDHRDVDAKSQDQRLAFVLKGGLRPMPNFSQ